MTKTVEVETPDLTYTASFTRKVSRGEYSNQDASEETLFVQVNVPANTDPQSDEGQIAMRSAMNAAKVRVLDSLGIPYEMSESGEIEEAPGAGKTAEDMVRAVFGQNVQTNAPTASASEASVGKEPPFIDPVEKSDEEFANRGWAKERFKSNPNEFFDNRKDKTNPKAPDIKHKDYRRGGGNDWSNSDIVAWLD